jgi:hypothetical protein
MEDSMATAGRGGSKVAMRPTRIAAADAQDAASDRNWERLLLVLGGEVDGGEQ